MTVFGRRVKEESLLKAPTGITRKGAAADKAEKVAESRWEVGGCRVKSQERKRCQRCQRCQRWNQSVTKPDGRW